jgi:hypothetical protein
MPRYTVSGDVLTAFTVEFEHPDFDALDAEAQNALVATSVGLKRFGREEGIRIDSVEQE